MAVFFVWAITSRAKSELGWRQLLGAALMVAALGMALV
jgi:hypothetical protein